MCVSLLICMKRSYLSSHLDTAGDDLREERLMDSEELMSTMAQSCFVTCVQFGYRRYVHGCMSTGRGYIVIEGILTKIEC